MMVNKKANDEGDDDDYTEDTDVDDNLLNCGIVGDDYDDDDGDDGDDGHDDDGGNICH